MKLVVLMGGNSDEREVSLKTGKAVVSAVEKLGFEVIPLVFESSVLPLLPELEQADLIFNALHGGSGENGVISGFLESLGKRYTGSNNEASAVCMNKHLSKMLVAREGIKTPRWKYFKKGEIISALSGFQFPVVIKPNDQGSTIGLSIVREKSEIANAVTQALNYGNDLLIEEYIAGREITVGIIGDEVLPIVEIIPSHELYDYSCKYKKGLSQYYCPAGIEEETTKKIRDQALQIFRLLGCRHYARIDFRLAKDNQPWFLEANTLPGMTATSLVPKAAMAAGYSFETLVNRIIKEALRN